MITPTSSFSLSHTPSCSTHHFRKKEERLAMIFLLLNFMNLNYYYCPNLTLIAKNFWKHPPPYSYMFIQHV